MLRNFIRDRGTQLSLGAFVATFVYSILVLASVTDPPNAFVPHFSVTTAVALTLVDLGVLIYYIDHIATSIQLTSVVSEIAQDFRATLANVKADAHRLQVDVPPGTTDGPLSLSEFEGRIQADESGFLQAIGHERLVEIATAANAVIRLLHRPGHFLVAGQLLAVVAPASAVSVVSAALTDAHIIGPSRTLTQDPVFAIDQLVEVALRALSPAVNDTFTALNCIDWLGDCLCRAFSSSLPSGIYRDSHGRVRLIEPAVTPERLLKGATDKIRQAGRGMPAVFIRQLEVLQKVMAAATNPGQREAILGHAELIRRDGEESIPNPADQHDVQTAYDALQTFTRRAWED
jgi:uncharacterized membrane protein